MAEHENLHLHQCRPAGRRAAAATKRSCFQAPHQPALPRSRLPPVFPPPHDCCCLPPRPRSPLPVLAAIHISRCIFLVCSQAQDLTPQGAPPRSPGSTAVASNSLMLHGVPHGNNMSYTQATCRPACRFAAPRCCRLPRARCSRSSSTLSSPPSSVCCCCMSASSAASLASAMASSSSAAAAAASLPAASRACSSVAGASAWVSPAERHSLNLRFEYLLDRHA